MRGPRKGVTLVGAAVLLALGVAYGVAQVLLRDTGSAATDSPDPSLVETGRYLARAGDCVACHTAHDGDTFAGGRAMATPLGTLYSTNITPDVETGIGRYGYNDFVRAVQRGIARDGHALYPAMPFPSYAVVSAQ